MVVLPHVTSLSAWCGGLAAFAARDQPLCVVCAGWGPFRAPLQGTQQVLVCGGSWIRCTGFGARRSSDIQVFKVRGPDFTIQVFQGATVRCPGLARPLRVLRTAIGAASEARARAVRHSIVYSKSAVRPPRARTAGAAIAPRPPLE